MKLACPLCGSKLNIRVDGFTCHEASGGPYLKGRIALTCSNKATEPAKRCVYMHTTNFKTSAAKTIERMEKVAGELIHKMPDFGPWEAFSLAEKESKPRGGYGRKKP